jgi:DNA polymerase-3 subunit delta'
VSTTAPLAGTEAHPHARVVLSAGLASGSPSHAYLFHGPNGTGKARAARALAAELLAEGDPDPESVRARVETDSHPDLTWVRPTGAHVMRVDDVEEAVIGAATRTPFEAARRVFVLERVDTMNDEVANRMLKTLEEPAHFVHLILLTDSIGRVLDTVKSRCQLVRFDPLPPATLAASLAAEGIPDDRAAASARLALGNGERARLLASDEGLALRAEAERMVRTALAGGGSTPDDLQPWRGLLDRAEDRRRGVEEAAAEESERMAGLAPKGRERRAVERELEEAAKRDGRRAHTGIIELGLNLMGAAFRDLACVAEGAPQAVLGMDVIEALGQAGAGRDAAALRQAVELCDATRQSLQQNVSEELALEALFYRLARLVGKPD